MRQLFHEASHSLSAVVYLLGWFVIDFFSTVPWEVLLQSQDHQATFMLKMVAALCWAADPEVRAKVGLEPLEPDPGTWREGE